MKENSSKYYLPSPSNWPIKGSIALICIFVGAANWLHDEWFGPYLFGFGFLVLLYMIFFFNKICTEISKLKSTIST